jgi:hypothetical protein
VLLPARGPRSKQSVSADDSLKVADLVLTKYVSPSLPTFASATTSSALVSFNNLCRPCRSDPSNFLEYTVTLELDIRGNPSWTCRIVSASPSTGSS